MRVNRISLVRSVLYYLTSAQLQCRALLTPCFTCKLCASAKHFLFKFRPPRTQCTRIKNPFPCDCAAQCHHQSRHPGTPRPLCALTFPRTHRPTRSFGGIVYWVCVCVCMSCVLARSLRQSAARFSETISGENRLETELVPLHARTLGRTHKRASPHTNRTFTFRSV